MIEKYQFLQSDVDENYLSIPLTLEFDFTRDEVDSFINKQVQNKLVNPIESDEITIYQPSINYDYIFYFSGSTTLQYSNLFNIKGVFDPITNKAFKSSLYIFEYYDTTNKDNQQRLFTEYYHLKQSDVMSDHNNISNYLRVGIPRKYLPNTNQIFLKVKFFDGSDGKLKNFKNYNLYNTTSEDALYYRISLNHVNQTYSFELQQLKFIEMVNNALYNDKINQMYPSLSAQTLTLPAGNFLSADGTYYDTTNPFNPKLISVDNGIDVNVDTFVNTFLFKWDFVEYNPHTLQYFNGVPYQLPFDKYVLAFKVTITRVEPIGINKNSDSNYYQRFLNAIDPANPKNNPDIVFNFTDSYSRVKKPSNTKVAQYTKRYVQFPRRDGVKDHPHADLFEDPSQSKAIFLDGNDDGYLSYVNDGLFPLDPDPTKDFYEFAYFIYDCQPILDGNNNPDPTKNAHGIFGLITSIEDDQTANILNYQDSNGITHEHIAYLIDKEYQAKTGNIIYTDSSSVILDLDALFPVEGTG